jgi:hypothetical protein
MQQKQQSLTIDGIEYITRPIPVYYASLYFTKIKKMLGGSIFQLAATVMKTTDTEEERKIAQIEIAGKVLDDIMSRNTADEIHKLFCDLLIGGNVYKKNQGEKASTLTDVNEFDEMNAMYQVLVQVLVQNFGEFLKKFMSSLKMSGSVMMGQIQE